MPIDQFHTERYIPDEENLLEYVIAVADAIAPDIAFDALSNPGLCDSQAPHIFKRRYNYGQLKADATYEEYITGEKDDNESVIKIVDAIGIDPEKFWYLILFVCDYVNGSTQNTYRHGLNPRKEIQRLIKFISANEDSSAPQYLFGVRHRLPMKLTLQIKGDRIIIDNPNTLSMIAEACRQALPSIIDSDIANTSPLGQNDYNKSDSVRIWLFADIFCRFFDIYPQFASQRKTGNITTKSTIHLISKIVYMVGLTSNPDYYYDDENLKAILQQYRGYTLDTINTIYG